MRSKSTMTRGDKRFSVTFIDEFSRYIRLHVLRNKDATRDAFVKYKNEVEIQLSKKIEKLRTDRGEYESNPFNSFYEDRRIIYETTPLYFPNSNGVAKMKNKTLKDMMNAMVVSLGALLNL